MIIIKWLVVIIGIMGLIYLLPSRASECTPHLINNMQNAFECFNHPNAWEEFGKIGKLYPKEYRNSFDLSPTTCPKFIKFARTIITNNDDFEDIGYCIYKNEESFRHCWEKHFQKDFCVSADTNGWIPNENEKNDGK